MFMHLARDAFALMSGILAIIHPNQYDMARLVKDHLLKTSTKCAPALKQWSSVYTAVTMIANRQSPAHRDTGSRTEWYDMLTSVGKFEEAPLSLGPIGILISNPPGTVSAFSGMAFSHSVQEIDHPRLSIALYLRENMQDFAGCDPAGWMTQMHYEQLIGPKRGCLRAMPFHVTEDEIRKLVDSLDRAGISK